MSKNVRLRSRERLNLFADLSTMLTAGIPIMEAVESLESDARGNMRAVVKELHHAINNGEPLSRAMGRLPKAFDPITVNLIRAAEAGGTLEETLQDIVVTTKKEIVFNDNIRTTMIYPIFVMVLFGAIVILMLTFVVPRIAKVFIGLRVHVPFVTRAMISASQFFMHNWLFIMAGIVLFIVLLVVLFRTQKRAIVRLLLGLPGLKKLGNNIELTRFTRSFSLLMHAGVPLEEALRLSRNVVQKKQLLNMISLMQENVQAGKPLSDGLRNIKGIVPPMMSRSIETAETAGTLEQTLQRLSEYFDNEVSESLKVLTSMLEPILLVVVGVMVGALMIAIIAPIYNLISQINPKK